MNDLADLLPLAEPWSCCAGRASVLQVFQSFALGMQTVQSPAFSNGKRWLDTLYCNRVSDINVRSLAVKSAEFLRRARQYARRHGLQFEFNPRRGKGSHGLVHKVLKDLGIDPKEF